MNLLPACGEKKEEQAERKRKPKRALTIIRNDDCLNCHSIEDKSVGPAYTKIAQRYDSDFSTVNRLAKKIVEGGGGLWGGEQMSKHPLLKSSDARRIVRWILSLDDSVANPNSMVATPAAVIEEATQNKTGLTLRAYALDNIKNFRSGNLPQISSDLRPQYTGTVNTVHFPESEAFAPLPEKAVLQLTGFITIGEAGKYFFKQVRTGKGRVKLDEALIVSENDWDRETDIDLTPGTYPITVEYLIEQEKKALSLQWITPEAEYYQVIPENVFTVSASQSPTTL